MVPVIKSEWFGNSNRFDRAGHDRGAKFACHLLYKRVGLDCGFSLTLTFGAFLLRFLAGGLFNLAMFDGNPNRPAAMLRQRASQPFQIGWRTQRIDGRTQMEGDALSMLFAMHQFGLLCQLLGRPAQRQ